MRIAILVLAIVGLGAAIWLLWPDSPADETPGTEAVASSTTTSTTQEPPTTTTVAPPTSTTSLQETHVVESVEEAEAILRELWFGWFEGIYNQDEERIREVVGNPELVDAAIEQFGAMDFERPPAPSLIEFSDTEILRSDESCLVIWTDVDATALVGETNDGVHVFLHENDWLFISQWANREDLWEDDCESRL
jgi:hypothetical protein